MPRREKDYNWERDEDCVRWLADEEAEIDGEPHWKALGKCEGLFSLLENKGDVRFIEAGNDRDEKSRALLHALKRCIGPYAKEEREARVQDKRRKKRIRREIVKEVAENPRLLILAAGELIGISSWSEPEIKAHLGTTPLRRLEERRILAGKWIGIETDKNVREDRNLLPVIRAYLAALDRMLEAEKRLRDPQLKRYAHARIGQTQDDLHRRRLVDDEPPQQPATPITPPQPPPHSPVSAPAPASGPSLAITPDPSLDPTSHDLAAAVCAQWEKERQTHRTNNPPPLPVRWEPAPEHIQDVWWSDHDADDSPLPSLAGKFTEIVDVFERIPSRRLVVLGNAGAGKTVLALEFVLGRLAPEYWHVGLPVPVILSLSSWDPTVPLDDWLSGQLLTNYRFLANLHRSGENLAAKLIQTHRVLPVLEGFDELAPGLQADALAALYQQLGPGYQFLLTSRPDEYRVAVEDSGFPLPKTAVVQIQDLELDDITQYLSQGTNDRQYGAGSAAKLRRIVSRLEADPAEYGVPNFRAALSTPLMVSLARVIYSGRTEADPDELFGLPDPASIQDHLLRKCVDAAYSTPHPPYSAEEAQRWLGFLALHLHQRDTRDLRWWDLSYAVRPWLFGRRDKEPRSIRSGRRVGSLLLGKIYRSVKEGSLIAVAIGLLGSLGDRSWPSLSGMLSVGILYILVAIAIRVIRLPRAETTNADAKRAISPRTLLQENRRTAWIRAVLFASPVGLVLLLKGAILLANGQILAAVGYLGIVSLLVFFLMLLDGVWGHWFLTRCWLSVTGRLPWRVMRFLEDAHRRGLLRQAGGAYQYRHALLQAHIASQALASMSSKATRRPLQYRWLVEARRNLALAWIEWGRFDLAERELGRVLAPPVGRWRRGRRDAEITLNAHHDVVTCLSQKGDSIFGNESLRRMFHEQQRGETLLTELRRTGDAKPLSRQIARAWQADNMFRLGVALLDEDREKEACKWLRRAARRGSAEASQLLDWLKNGQQANGEPSMRLGEELSDT